MPISKRVSQYEIERTSLKIIATYDSINAASVATGISRHTIYAALDNKHQTNCKYVWKYADEKVDELTPIPDTGNKIAQIEPYSDLILNIFPSIREASRQTNISASHISECVNGKIDKAGKWIWKRLSDIDIICNRYAKYK